MWRLRTHFFSNTNKGTSFLLRTTRFAFQKRTFCTTLTQKKDLETTSFKTLAKAFATADKYDMVGLEQKVSLKTGLEPQKLLHKYRSKGGSDVLHFRTEKNRFSNKPGAPAFSMSCLGDEPLDVFWFEEGTFVFWGRFDNSAQLAEVESSLLDIVSDFSQSPHPERRSDQMLYERTEQSGVDALRDVIMLSRSEWDVYQKLSFSYGLARAVKLDYLERHLSEVFNRISEIATKLQQGLHPQITNADVARIMNLRHAVNIGAKMLEPPLFLWEDSELAGLFEEIEMLFDLKKRVQLMNKQLDSAEDYIHLFNNFLADKMDWKIEIIIIVLIAIELLFLLANKSTTWQEITYWELMVSAFQKLSSVLNSSS